MVWHFAILLSAAWTADGREGVDPKLAAEGRFAVFGRVLSADDGTPLEGVEMTASVGLGTLRPAARTRTDKGGSYRLVFGPGGGLSRGEVGGMAIVHAGKPGWYGRSHGRPAQFILSKQPLAKPDVPKKTTNLVVGEATWVDFRMRPAASLTVKLVDGTGRPLANARLLLTGENLLPGASVVADRRTDAAGALRITEVPRDRYRLVLVEDRRQLELGSIDFADAAEYEAVATLHEWTPAATHASLKVTLGKAADR